jgi:hypothetical protein
MFPKKSMPAKGMKMMKMFEKSGADKEPKGMKEGSKAEKKLDAKGSKAFSKKK